MANRASWRQWKGRVRIPQLLEAAGWIHLFRLRGARLAGPCPVHTVAALPGNNPQAFQVDLERDLWFCFTRCARGGDVIDLAWRLSGSCWTRTARWMKELANQPVHDFRAAASPCRSSTQLPPDFRPFKRSLPLDPAHPFFRTLGLAPDTVRRFEAGAWYGPGFLDGTVAVRLHDPRGNPLGYAGRRLDPKAIARWGKWKWPTGFPKSQTLWNWHRVRPDAPDGLILVEGPWSVMKLWQAGFPNAIALGGLAISPHQCRLLNQARELTLILDADEAGLRATARHRDSNFHPCIRVLHPPESLDPADLSESQLIQLLKP